METGMDNGIGGYGLELGLAVRYLFAFYLFGGLFFLVPPAWGSNLWEHC